jgi:hypothetical protein
MASAPTNRAPSLHQRGTAAVILSRYASADAGPSRRDSSGPAVPGGSDDDPGSHWRTVLTWVLLGTAIAALRLLLLAGDSLSAPA